MSTCQCMRISSCMCWQPMSHALACIHVGALAIWAGQGTRIPQGSLGHIPQANHILPRALKKTYPNLAVPQMWPWSRWPCLGPIRPKPETTCFPGPQGLLPGHGSGLTQEVSPLGVQVGLVGKAALEHIPAVVGAGPGTGNPQTVGTVHQLHDGP